MAKACVEAAHQRGFFQKAALTHCGLFPSRPGRSMVPGMRGEPGGGRGVGRVDESDSRQDGRGGEGGAPRGGRRRAARGVARGLPALRVREGLGPRVRRARTAQVGVFCQAGVSRMVINF